MDVANRAPLQPLQSERSKPQDNQNWVTSNWLISTFTTTDTTNYIEVDQLVNAYERAFPEQENRITFSELGKLLKRVFPALQKRRMMIQRKRKREWTYSGLMFKVQNNSVSNTAIWEKIPCLFSCFGGWTLISNSQLNMPSLNCYEWVYSQDNIKQNNTRITRELKLVKNGRISVTLVIAGKIVPQQVIPDFSNGDEGSKKSLENLFSFCSSARICTGFEVDVSKNTFNKQGVVIGRTEQWHFKDSANNWTPTLRHQSISCHLLLTSNSLHQKFCHSCSTIRHNSFWKSFNPVEDSTSSPSPNMKFKRESYMSNEECLAKLAQEKMRRRNAEKREIYSRRKIEEGMKELHDDDNEDLLKMLDLIEEKSVSDDMRLFYQIQKENIGRKSKTGYRWHPKVIRMCLSVWNRSPQAYRELCASGMLALPSGRLLRYYKNSIKQNAGLNKEVFELMRNEATKWKVPKCGYRGGIILDEMSIQEDIQLKQENGLMKLVGFTDIGEEDNAMRALKTGSNDAVVAKQVLQLCFLGNTGFRFPFAHFPTDNTSPGCLMFIFWRSVKWLLRNGFDAFYCCLDGSTCNRSFIKVHFKDADPVERRFTVTNPHTRNPFIFMMDPEHNMKKIRNNIWKSGTSTGSKRILCKGKPPKFILWKHFEEAFEWDQKKLSLKLHQKLTPAHFDLNPASLMRNHLAFEVLNKDMLFLMKSYQSSLPSNDQRRKYDETIRFLENTSQVIDIFHSWQPVDSKSDERFGHLKTILKWFEDWEAEAHAAPATPAERKKMILSDKTIFDIKSMIIGFEEICKEVFREHPETYLLPWRINTNLVENIFCQQRGLQGQNDNPRYTQYQSGMNTVLLGCRTTTNKSNTGHVESLPFYQPKKLHK